MNKKIFFILGIFILGFVCAGFDVGDSSHSIDVSYGSGEPVTGWFNISLDEQNSNSEIGDSLGNSITLLELLEKNSNSHFDYSCNTENCVSDYSFSNPSATKNYNLKRGGYKVFGIVISGKTIQSINFLKFNITSDAESSCINQLKVDVLGNGIYEGGNNKIANAYCSYLKSSGCFDSGKRTDEYLVNRDTQFCQRIKISESPGFRVGAWIKNDNSADVEVYAELKDKYLNPLSDEGVACQLEYGAGQGEVTCKMDHLITKADDYYVCIYGTDEGEGSVKVRGYEDVESGCGFFNSKDYDNYGLEDENAAYDFFIEGMKFDEPGNFLVNSSLSSENSPLIEEINNYLIERYPSNERGIDCTGGCILPVVFKSGETQEISLSKLYLEYNTVSGKVIDDNAKFYELDIQPAKITADFEKIYLDDAGFYLGEDYETFDYGVNINDEEIFTQEISIEDVPEVSGIYPSTTSAGLPTNFEIIVEGNRTISRYTWNFGDGTSELETTTSKAKHTYNSTGNYNLVLISEDSAGLTSTQTFKISVQSPKNAAETNLNKKLENLKNAKADLNAFSDFDKKSLDDSFSLGDVEEELKELQMDFTGSSTEEEYKEVLTAVLALEVPKSVAVSQSVTDLPFYPAKEVVDFDAVSNFDSSDRDNYLSALYSWLQENMEIKISYKEISANYEGDVRPILNVFDFSLSEKQTTGGSPMFFIKNLENLKFKDNYNDVASGEYKKITLLGDDMNVVFSTTESYDFVNVPAFVSPSLSKLPVSIPGPVTGEPKGFKWGLFFLIIVLLILLALAGYIGMQVWYKKQYEGYLFKNSGDAKNLIVYIKSEKQKGVKDSDIEKNLKKSKWNSEQIDYAMSKASGRGVGLLFEIPVEGVVNKYEEWRAKKSKGKETKKDFNPFMKKPMSGKGLLKR